MAGKSNIEWTEATWNPIVGCSIVSPGCTNCYAMKMAARIEAMKRSHYDGTTKRVNGNAVWTGNLALAPEAKLIEPLRRKKPTTYFVNSMGDLFHEDIPDEWIDKVFSVMALAPQHTYQVLTKRAERMRKYFTRPDTPWSPRDDIQSQAWLKLIDLHGDIEGLYSRALDAVTPWPLPNVWLGVSTERQQEFDERWPHLRETPAAVRFISYEPALGPLDVTLATMCRGDQVLDWLICGGESGPGARPMNPQWARDVRDQCRAWGIAFFHKQNGEFVSVSEVEGEGAHFHFPDGRTVRRVGKKAAGRLLDGKEHNEFPGCLPSALAAPQNKTAQVQP